MKPLLGRSWVALGALLDAPETLLGRSWTPLGRSWAILLDKNDSKTVPKSDFRRSWLDFDLILLYLASSLGCSGPSKSSSRAGENLIFMFFQFQLSTGTFGSTWSFLGASWPLLGPTWRQLGRSWDQLGANLGAVGTKLGPT